MHQNAFPSNSRVFYKLADRPYGLASLVEEELGIGLFPGHPEVLYALGFKVIWHFLARAVDDVSYLVVENELKVLGRIVISDEEAVLDLYPAHYHLS